MTDRARLQDWLNEVEIPAGYDTGFLAGVRRRRRARARSAVALATTTAGCLAAAAFAVPWSGPDGTTAGPPSTVGGSACAVHRDPARDDLTVTVANPSLVNAGTTAFLAVTLENSGAEPVRYSGLRLSLVLCVSRPGEPEMTQVVAPDLGPSRPSSGTIAPHSALGSAFTWAFHACRDGEDPRSGGCTAGGLPEGDYVVTGHAEAVVEGRERRLVSVPVTMIVQPTVTG